ncbi:serine carboxypeptidase [Pycnococcus provasolii]
MAMMALGGVAVTFSRPLSSLFLRFLFHAAFLLAASSYEAASSDLITTLPDYGPPPTPTYSGFLPGVDPGTNLHYWLATSSAEGVAASVPLVIWLNGGPGSSSLLGMLQEHGPLLVNASGGLMENPYAWTTLANVVAIESPAGVGYSYCAAMANRTGDCHPSDTTAARDAAFAVAALVNDKFPELKDKKTYITGESYAGVYVPMLAEAILEYNTAYPQRAINLKGIAAGDPCTDNESQQESMDMLWYAHKYGLVPDADFNLLWNTCGHRYPRAMHDDASKLSKPTRRVVSRHSAASILRGQPSAECIAAERRFLLGTSDSFSQVWPLAYINDVSLYGPSALVSYKRKGSLNYKMEAWLNRPDVRAALHVDGAPTKQWPGPPDGWTYTKETASCNPEAAPGAPSMVDYYRRIAPQLETTTVFNGDTDPCVSYEGTRAAVLKVGFAQLDGGDYRPWFYNATASSAHLLAEKALLFGPSLAMQPAGAQFGGHVVNYENNFQFLTVHGSGHMVPQFRPRATLHFLKRFLSHEALSPLYVSAQKMESMSESDFEQYMDAWTTEATSDEYLV